MPNNFETNWEKLKPAARRVSFLYVINGNDYGSHKTIYSPRRNKSLGVFAGVSFTIGKTDFVLFEDGRFKRDSTRMVLRHFDQKETLGGLF